MNRVLVDFQKACEEAKDFYDLGQPFRELTLGLGFQYSTLTVRSHQEMKMGKLSPKYFINNTSPLHAKVLLQALFGEGTRPDILKSSPVFQAIERGDDYSVFSPHEFGGAFASKVLKNGETDWGMSIVLPYIYEFMWGGLVLAVSAKTPREEFDALVEKQLYSLKLARSILFHIVLTKKLAMPENPLSELQRKILAFHAEGLSQTQIAERLSVETKRTIRTATDNIRHDLAVDTIKEALVVACKLNYL